MTPSDKAINPLIIENLCIDLDRSGTRIVDDISLTVRPGEIRGLVGESGSGKSLSCLAALGLLGDGWTLSGSIRLAGAQTPRDIARRRGSDAAMIFQDATASLNPIRCVGHQVSETVRRLRRVSPHEARGIALDLLRRVDIPDPETRYNAYPFQLSGGQNQRVMIALALAGNPKILFADEPTTALDVTIQSQILELLKSIRDDTGMGIVFVSHDLGVIEEICDTVSVMCKGQIVESGSVEEVMRQPKHAYTQNLIAAMPRLAVAKRTSKEVRDASVETQQLLEIKAASCDYRVREGTFRAVSEVSLAVDDTESLAVIGESGSGKSTLGKLILGIEPPAGGEVLFQGQPVPCLGSAEHRTFARSAQLVPQNPYLSLDPRATIGDQIEEPLIIHGIGSDTERRQTRDGLLTDVGLHPDLRSRYPHELSGGQCQRAVIARALCLEPKLLVCDEATASLDVSVQARIIALLRDLQTKFSLSLVFITHDLRLVGELCQSVAVMRGGQLVEHGPTEQVLTYPRHIYTRDLIDAVPERERAVA
ncbi:MAG: ABC transporter ATP-binding protein [Pseudomonadota bacterium]